MVIGCLLSLWPIETLGCSCISQRLEILSSRECFLVGSEASKGSLLSPHSVNIGLKLKSCLFLSLDGDVSVLPCQNFWFCGGKLCFTVFGLCEGATVQIQHWRNWWLQLECGWLFCLVLAAQCPGDTCSGRICSNVCVSQSAGQSKYWWVDGWIWVLHGRSCCLFVHPQSSNPSSSKYRVVDFYHMIGFQGAPPCGAQSAPTSMWLALCFASWPPLHVILNVPDGKAK